jgi:hypothetical protein
MKKILLAILLLINTYILFSVYDTEYSHINNKSHQWQQAGLENGYPVNFVEVPLSTTNTEVEIRFRGSHRQTRSEMGSNYPKRLDGLKSENLGWIYKHWR